MASTVVPLATPLPDGPTEESLTAAQWTTLMAIMDTVIPSIRRDTTTNKTISQLTIADVQYNTAAGHIQKTMVNAPDSESFDEYLNEKASDHPRFQALLKRTLAHYTPEESRKGLAFILSALE